MAKKKVVKKKTSKKVIKKKGGKKSPPKVGRPTKYKKEYDQKLIKHMAGGYSYESFAGSINVCVDTLYEWESVHDSFSDAKKVGRAKGLQSYEELILMAARGYIDNFNATAAVWFGKNVYRWRDKDKENKQKSTTININIDKDDDKL